MRLPLHLCGALLFLALLTLRADDKPWLDREYSSAHFQVDYTTDCSSAPPDSDCGAVESDQVLRDHVNDRQDLPGSVARTGPGVGWPWWALGS